MNGNLDLTGLFEDDAAPQKRKVIGDASPQSRAETGDTEPKSALDIYQRYQNNVKLSSSLQVEILKGVSAGEDLQTLFLKAVKVISCMTGNKYFYEQIEKDLKRNIT